MASLMDDEAERSGEEDAHEDDGDDGDEAKNAYEKDGFIVSDNEKDGDDDDLGDDDSDDDDDEAPRKKFSRLKKKKRAAELDDDDFDLVRENLGVADDDDQPVKRARVDVTAASANELENKLFDDEDDDGAAAKRAAGRRADAARAKPQRRAAAVGEEYFDEDNFDDFIEDDLGDDDGEARRPRGARRAYAEPARADGVNQMQLHDIVELFGEGAEDDILGGFEDEAKPAATGRSVLMQQFSDQALGEHYVDAEDDLVRARDVPERLQLRAAARAGSRSRDDFEAQLDDEANWVGHRLRGEAVSQATADALKKVLSLINLEALEVPFIAGFRRDYFVTHVSPTELWKIYDLDDEWAAIQGASRDTTKLLRSLAAAPPRDDDENDDDAAAAAESQALLAPAREAADADVASTRDRRAYARLVVAAYGGQAADLPKQRRAARDDVEFLLTCRAAGLREYAATWATAADGVDEAVRYGRVALPPTPAAHPEDHAASFVKAHLATADDVRGACVAMLAHELAALPAVRAAARRAYRAVAHVSTAPTAKGLAEIDFAHEAHGLQYLVKKPVADFLGTALKKSAAHRTMDAALYARLHKAEADGLVTVTIGLTCCDGAAAAAAEAAAGAAAEAAAAVVGAAAAGGGTGGAAAGAAAAAATAEAAAEAGARLKFVDYGPKLAREAATAFLASPFGDAGAGDGLHAAAWDRERRLVVERAFDVHLLPLLRDELRREMKRKGDDAVIELAAAALRRRLDVGPFRTAAAARDGSSAAARRHERPRAVGVCVARENRESTVCAALDAAGAVRGALDFSGSAQAARDPKTIVDLARFLLDHRPDVVVVSTSAGVINAGRTKRLCEDALARAVRLSVDAGGFEDEDEDDERHRRDECEDWAGGCQIVFGEDTHARCFAFSKRATSEFGVDLAAPAARFAVSLARYAQSPLSELAYMWTTTVGHRASKEGLRGGEMLALNPTLHALADSVAPARLLRAYERVLVDATNAVGVDVNAALGYDHHFGMLQFVCGLGPRKARGLRFRARARRGGAGVASRRELAQLFDGGGERSICFANAAAFCRVRPLGALADVALDPFDDTRVHPECYFNDEVSSFDWAPKMCADAMDADYVVGADYADFVLRAMRDSAAALSRETAADDKRRWQPPKFGTPHHAAAYATAEERAAGVAVEEADDEADEILADMVAQLDLTAYADLLEAEYARGKRREQLEDVKRELRRPYHDPRPAPQPPSASEVFNWFSGGSYAAGQLRPRRALTARVVGADGYRLFLECDVGGLKASVHREFLASDGGRVDHVDEWRRSQDRLPQDKHLLDDDVVDVAVKALDVERLRIDCSRHDDDVFFPLTVEACDAALREDQAYRPLCDNCDREKLISDYVAHATALRDAAHRLRRDRVSATSKSRAGARHRAIVHPAFRPQCRSFKDAEAQLALEGAGDVVVRQSAASGKLALTWAFRAGVYKHVEIDDVDGAADANRYRIGREEYADLDEVLARYVQPLNDYAEDLAASPKFRGDVGNEAAATAALKKARASGGSIPYALWVDAKYPGSFALSFLPPRATKAKLEWVKVTPDGLSLRGTDFQSVVECLDHFKLNAKKWAAQPYRPEAEQVQQQQQQQQQQRPLADQPYRPPARSPYRPPAPQGMMASDARRQPQWGPGPPPPPPPPPPPRDGFDQRPPQGPYGAQPYQQFPLPPPQPYQFPPPPPPPNQPPNQPQWGAPPPPGGAGRGPPAWLSAM
ncbi:SH2 domain-containing protein [Pelagophyceae sp. CCMP2097]|nr:SH2 domain-containing protein [Pelagophyceae sp. CCMP2097]